MAGHRVSTNLFLVSVCSPVCNVKVEVSPLTIKRLILGFFHPLECKTHSGVSAHNCPENPRTRSPSAKEFSRRDQNQGRDKRRPRLQPYHRHRDVAFLLPLSRRGLKKTPPTLWACLLMWVSSWGGSVYRHKNHSRNRADIERSMSQRSVLIA